MATEFPGVAPSSDSAQPFVGLRPFDIGDSPWFFGRNDQAYEMLRWLNSTHFLAVVGPSGCGKSSLVRAGVLAALRDGYLTNDGEWTIVVLEPRNAPLAEWQRNLEPHLRTGANVSDLLTDASAALDTSRGPLVIVVDQFEDLFKFGKRENRQDEVQKFIVAMLSAAAADARVFTIVTMRSEFIEDCGSYPALAEAMNAGLYLLPRMTREQLHTAVIAPLQKAGGSMTADFLTHLLDDASRETDGLPILQHALAQLWPKRKPFEPMGMDLYPAEGGLADFIDQHADDTFLRLSEADRVAAELLFRAIVDVSEEGLTLSRPLPFVDIVAETGADPARLETVLKLFREEGFLRAFTPNSAEAALTGLTHEAVARQWKRYVSWIQKENQARHARLNIVQAAKEYWAATGRHKKDYLIFQGQRLDDLEGRLDNAKRRLSSEELLFLKKCRRNARLSRIFSPTVVGAALIVILFVAGALVAGIKVRADAAATVKAIQAVSDAKTQTAQAQTLVAESAYAQAAQKPVAPAAVGSKAVLYPQIWNDDQKNLIEAIRIAARAIGVQVPNPEVVTVGPASDQVRYFYPEDADKAGEIQALLNKNGVDAGPPKLVQGFAGKVRKGHFELWLKRPAADGN